LGRILPSKLNLAIDSKGKIIGNIRDGKKVFDKKGKHIGSLEKTGKVVDLKENVIGRAIASGTNFALSEKGIIIGKILPDGSVIDMQSNIIGIVKKDNSIVDNVEDGKVIGYSAGITNFAISNDGEVLGSALLDGAIVNEEGRVIARANKEGKIYQNTSVIEDEDKRFMGYSGDDLIRNREGHIIGTMLVDGAVVSKTGSVIGDVQKDGYVRDKNDNIVGYAGDKFVRDEESKVIGFVKENGSVVSLDKKVIGTLDKKVNVVNLKGNHLGFLDKGNNLVFDTLGKVAGARDAGNLVVGASGKIIGSIDSQGFMIDNQGSVKGYSFSKAAFNEKSKFIGYKNNDGKIIDSKGRIIGQSRTSEKAVGRVSFGGDSWVRDRKGFILGRVMPDGKAVSMKGYVLGFVKTVEPQIVRDASGNIIGRVLPNGLVVDSNGNIIGYLGKDGNVFDVNGKIIGKAYKIDKSKQVFDEFGNVIGSVLEDGTVVDEFGNVIGSAKADGTIEGKDGEKIGSVSIAKKEEKKKENEFGEKAEGERWVRDKDGKIIGKVRADGMVVDANGNVVGKVLPDGTVVGRGGKVFGVAEKDKFVRDKDGNIIGEIRDDGIVVDNDGKVIGKLGKNGVVKDANGKVIGYAGRDWKEGVPEFISPEILKAVGSVKLSDGTEVIPAVGAIPSDEDDDYSGSSIGEALGIGMAITPDGEALGRILENGEVVDINGKVIGYKRPDGTIVDLKGNVIGIEDPNIDEGSLDDGSVFVPPGTFGAGGAYGIGAGAGGNLGPGGGYGAGERYDPLRMKALMTAQNNRKKTITVGSLAKEYSPKSKSAIDKQNEDWDSLTWEKSVSTWKVDMSNVVLADKPIPAVLVRSIDSRIPVPVTAIVERNIYAEDGRNIIIPAGSKVIGEMTGSGEDSKPSPKMEISWTRLIRPDGGAFKLEEAVTGDAQGRGGATGYVDMQLMNKYALPIMTSSITSLIKYYMASDEVEQDTNGDGEAEKTPRQEAAEDARETFGNGMDRVFNQLMEDKSKLETVIFIPAGSRITVYPKVDLWLRREVDDERDAMDKDVLVNKEYVEGENEKIQKQGGSVSTSQTTYEAEGAGAAQSKAYSGKKQGGLASGAGAKRQQPQPVDAFAPPTRAVMTNSAPPPGTFTPPKETGGKGNEGVPELFD
jgi:type IV secretion system protein VirB10